MTGFENWVVPISAAGNGSRGARTRAGSGGGGGGGGSVKSTSSERRNGRAQIEFTEIRLIGLKRRKRITELIS